MTINPAKAPFTHADREAITKYDYKNQIVPPNFWPVTIDEAISAMCRSNVSASMAAWVRFEEGGHPTSARYFFEHGQDGSWHGNGWVVWTQQDDGFKYVAHAAKFAICEHVKVEDPGADHRRGWHPGRCSKCGLGMTVDSGD